MKFNCNIIPHIILDLCNQIFSYLPGTIRMGKSNRYVT